MERLSVVAHAQQSSDDEKTMRVTCYVLCTLSIAIWVGLLLYTMLQ
jgi:hypothetical protein